VQLAPAVHSTIAVDAPLATTAHSLAQLARRPADGAFLRARLAACDAALDAFEAALAHPLTEIDEVAARAYHATLVLACTLASTAVAPSLRRATLSTLALLERLVNAPTRAVGCRLLSAGNQGHQRRFIVDAID
jgi:hypothetical protein